MVAAGVSGYIGNLPSKLSAGEAFEVLCSALTNAKTGSYGDALEAADLETVYAAISDSCEPNKGE